jgi:hypothetical protein
MDLKNLRLFVFFVSDFFYLHILVLFIVILIAILLFVGVLQ